MLHESLNGLQSFICYHLFTIKFLHLQHRKQIASETVSQRFEMLN